MGWAFPTTVSWSSRVFTFYELCFSMANIYRRFNHNQPQYRTHSFPPPNGPQGQFFQNQPGQYGGPHSQMQHGYQPQQFRGSQGFRHNQFSPVQDRRFSGPQNFQRGGGHFSNLQWSAPNGRG